MILVTGATGHLGRAVIRRLLKNTPANKIAAFVRDESKAFDLKEAGFDIRVGSYDDVVSLDAAMRGIEKVLLIASNDEDNRAPRATGNNIARDGGFGLIGIVERAKLLGGVASIESTENSGTTVFVIIPITLNQRNSAKIDIGE
jgi:uncharacterized protein YbjT (DUF2867 family)